MHPLDNATFQPVTEPLPGATLPSGPFKLLTGGDPITVRPLSGSWNRLVHFGSNVADPDLEAGQ